MKKKSNSINRRSFIQITGTTAAGLTISLPSLYGTSIKSINRWWEKEPLRIIELEQGYEYPEKFKLLNEMGANMEHATRFTDTSPGTSFLDNHNLFSGKKVNFNSLKNYLSEAHKKGVRVIIYYNVHAIEINYARRHPEWQQIKADGNPIENVYTVDSSFCINSPWREEVFATLRKLASFEIDGVFYDGPIFFSNTCYCNSCQELFRERYQKELPSKTVLSSNMTGPEWPELLEFQSDSIARFLRDSNKILKDINPEILFYMNGNNLAPSWPTGRNNRKIIRETDILGAEGGFLYGELKEPVYKPGAMAKLLETQAEGKPTVVFDAAKQGPWAFSTLPRGEISILYSQSITHQANVWLAISAISNINNQSIDVIQEYNKLIRENPDPFFRTKSMAKIALLWPQNTGNYYRGSSVPLTDFTKEINTGTAGNIQEEFYGFYDGLSRNHFPFDVLDEEALNDDLHKYDLVILPNVSCLGEKEADRIKDFVKNGGNIISTFETSLYNERGKRLENFELKDLFGAEKSGGVIGPLRWDYLSADNHHYFALRDIKNKYLNAPSYGLRVKTNSKIPLFFCNPLPGSYSGTPQISNDPFMIENTYGKGKSIYIAGTFGSSLYKFHFPEYYRILGNLVSELSEPVIKTDHTPSSVEVNIRRNENSVFVYLINFTSGMKRPIAKIIPCYNIKVEIPLVAGVKGMKALVHGKDIHYMNTGHSISFELPVLEDYEIISIEM